MKAETAKFGLQRGVNVNAKSCMHYISEGISKTRDIYEQQRRRQPTRTRISAFASLQQISKSLRNRNRTIQRGTRAAQRCASSANRLAHKRCTQQKTAAALTRPSRRAEARQTKCSCPRQSSALARQGAAQHCGRDAVHGLL